MSNRSILLEGTSRIISYLRSWQIKGRYNSIIVHRGNLKRMGNIHDTPWCQAPIIEGYLELIQRSDKIEIVPLLLDSVSAQCANQEPSGRFRNAGHEDDRFSSLVHNALASSSLLRFARYQPPRHMDTEKWDKMRGGASTCALRNIEALIRDLWIPAKGAFAFDTVDHYSGNSDHCVLNMNAIMLETLLLAKALTRSDKYVRYAQLVTEFLWNRMKAASFRIVPYSDIMSDIEIHLYTGFVGRGLLAALADDCLSSYRDRIGRMLELCEDRLKAARISKYHSYTHGSYHGQDIMFPIFLAGSGVITDFLLGLAMMRKDSVAEREYRTQLASLILSWQRPSGGVSSFCGYSTKDNFRPRDTGVVWEDMIPTPAWNGFLFRCLSRALTEDECQAVDVDKVVFASDIVVGPRYVYAEWRSALAIVGWWPLRSVGIYIYRKSACKALVWWDIRRVRHFFRKDWYCN